MATRIEPKDQVQELKSLPGWEIQNEVLSHRFEFNTYLAGLDFAVAVGKLAESMDHHPDITIGYKSVLISTSTHSAGGITHLDFELAHKIQQL